MNTKTLSFCLVIVTIIAFSCKSVAQRPQKPLTNDDVIAMVHKKLPESVIVSAIQARPGKFNPSTNELIRLISDDAE